MMHPKQIIKKYIETHPAPARGLIIDTVEYPDYLAIRMYRDNFNSIPDSKQQDMVEWVETLLKEINSNNEFSLTLEMEGYVS